MYVPWDETGCSWVDQDSSTLPVNVYEASLRKFCGYSLSGLLRFTPSAGCGLEPTSCVHNLHLRLTFPVTHRWGYQSLETVSSSLSSMRGDVLAAKEIRMFLDRNQLGRGRVCWKEYGGPLPSSIVITGDFDRDYLSQL